MNPPPSGAKRARQSPSPPLPDPSPTPPNSSTTTTTTLPSSSSFRNVSACNRCRLRKNRCDQNLPACSACAKARLKCVGYDPLTKREIPRNYVYYLESRLAYLESLLESRGIAYGGPEKFDLGAKPIVVDASTGAAEVRVVVTSEPVRERRHHHYHAAGHAAAVTTATHTGTSREQELDADADERGGTRSSPRSSPAPGSTWDEKEDEAEKLNTLVSNIGMVSVQGASDPRYLGSTSGISFARVVFAAVKSSVAGSSGSGERAGGRAGKVASASGGGGGATAASASTAAVSGTSMRDSFFGLQSRPATRRAPFPDKELGSRLVELYFEHANPQIPILHRGEFMALFDRAYAVHESKRTPRELYLLNIVFAIGAGIILGAPEARSPSPKPASTSASASASAKKKKKKSPPPMMKREPSSPTAKRLKLSAQQHQPEEYQASAMVHLESFLGSTPAADRPDGFGGSLEELQAVLLLAGFALLRPVAPGLWYIVGVAVRLAVDLGLHYEDGTGIDDDGVASQSVGVRQNGVDAKERGRREWVRDLRRRLWWCVYSFDRLVSTCVGRPFGITDHVITTEFPSILDDSHITTSGFTAPPGASSRPSSKRVAHHYFRLRLLQSEILQVLQHRQAKQARERGKNSENRFMHKKLKSPFLQSFESFAAWRRDIDRRLWEWKESAPTQDETTVQFSVQFLELNYWQAVIMLYRQSLSVPPELGGEVSPSEEIASPMSVNLDDRESDEDVFWKVAEAGQKVLKLYRQLHRVHLVNYTFLATHHLFMAGIAFLYAIWHSATVRSRLTLDDVDNTTLAATSVLGDLIEKCPPAEACRDAFERMSRATVQMCQSTTGFGSGTSQAPSKPKYSHSSSSSSPPSAPYSMPPSSQPNRSFHQGQPPPPRQINYEQSRDERHYFQTQRPRPQFDMNLRDLFPQDSNELRDSSQNLGRWHPPAPRSSPSHSSDAAFSTPRGSQQSIPYRSPPAMSSYEQMYAPPNIARSTRPMPGINSIGTDAPAAQEDAMDTTPDSVYNLPGNGLGPDNPHPDNTNTAVEGGYDDFANFPLDMDTFLAESTGQYSGHPGLALGFDNEHDWSEGGAIDFLDGYFFGGVGT